MLFCCALVVFCLSIELQPQSSKHEPFSDEKEGWDRSSAEQARSEVYLQVKQDLTIPEYSVCEMQDNAEYCF